MAQAFITTYRNNFRYNTQARVKPIYPLWDYTDCDVDKALWMTPEDNVDEEDTENFAKIVNTVKQMQLNRMKSTYQTEFGKDSSKQALQIDPSVETESYENQFLENCKQLYVRRNQKLLKPITTSRTINGFLRPQRLFTPLTVYQNEIGRVGYNRLKQV